MWENQNEKELCCILTFFFSLVLFLDAYWSCISRQLISRPTERETILDHFRSKFEGKGNHLSSPRWGGNQSHQPLFLHQNTRIELVFLLIVNHPIIVDQRPTIVAMVSSRRTWNVEIKLESTILIAMNYLERHCSPSSFRLRVESNGKNDNNEAAVGLWYSFYYCQLSYRWSHTSE